MKKFVIFILIISMVMLSLVGCTANKGAEIEALQKEIESLKAQLKEFEDALPLYRVEGVSNNYTFLNEVFYVYITVTGEYTMEDLIEITKQEYKNDGLEYWYNFFEPYAPLIEDTESDAYGLPDRKYSVAEIAAYTYKDRVRVKERD